MNESEVVHLDENTIVEVADALLFDAQGDFKSEKILSIPIAELSTLGAGVSTLLPALRSITQTTTINTPGLFQLANATVGDKLKAAKNGNFWGAFKTSDGVSKFAQLQEAGPLTVNTKTVASINPATIMMAVALFSIEQKLGHIEKKQDQILSFLENEKESEIEADLKVLSNIVRKYKLNWDNEYYVASSHKQAMDIRRTARKNMTVYKKQIDVSIDSQKLFVMHNQVISTLKQQLKNFKYYRLSLYTYSMASMVEIMLSGNFKEENIEMTKAEIEKLSLEYRKRFRDCSVRLEELSKKSINTKLCKEIGNVSKNIGNFLGSIPRVKEAFHDRGEHIISEAREIELSFVNEFAQINNPETHLFIDNMKVMIQIYNYTEHICFDNKKIYLIGD